MDTTQVFEQFGVALALGLLVGLQRESAQPRLAGIRTFPLITLLGALSALLAQSFGGAVLAVGFLVVAALIVIGKLHEIRLGVPGPGLTSEVAMVLLFAIGALLVLDQRSLAIALAGTCAVLLQFKGQLHGFVQRLGERDLRAIMQFVLVALVILPVLPDRTFGPYDVLNPRRIWTLVVLIIGLSLLGYIVSKFVGERAGILLSGILGGMVSSTATTVSQARRSRIDRSSVPAAAIVIMLASSVMYGRILLLVAVVAPEFFPTALPPLAILLGTMLLLAMGSWIRGRSVIAARTETGSPAEMRAALVFGLLYAVVLFLVAAVREHFGSSALYVVAGVSGLTDVDAMTLSASQFVHENRLDAATAWRLVVLATLSNAVFKAGAVWMWGHPDLRRRVSGLFGILLVVGAGLIFFWPA